jgi:hypothetical protein
MKPLFESIAKIGEVFSFGNGTDKIKPEAEVQNRSKAEKSAIPKNQANNQKPDVVIESKQDNTEEPKPRTRRTVERLCHYCHNFFIANRRDANYCCTSHRQMANKKGYYFRYHGNPAEHYLVKAIRFDIKEILKHDNEEITHNIVNNWYHMFIMARPLFINDLSDNNHLVIFYSNYIEEFIAYLMKQQRNLNTDRYILTIPQSTRDVWQRFLHATA